MPDCSLGCLNSYLKYLVLKSCNLCLIALYLSVTTRLYPIFENTFLVVISFNFEAKVSAQEYLRI
jgi:hypothetical protein